MWPRFSRPAWWTPTSSLLFRVGRFFEGQTIGTGQADAKQYAHALRDLVVAGPAEPGFVVSKELGLNDAPDAYARFGKREEGYSKVPLQPARG